MTSTQTQNGATDPQTVESRPLGILVRAKTRNFLSQFPYAAESDTPGFAMEEARHAEFSPTGDYFVSVEGEQSPALIRDAVDSKIVATCGGLEDTTTPLKVNFATFSPRGSYLLTWARPSAGVNVPNLVIYRVPTGERLAAFYQKTFHLGFWPSVQWSDDESIAAHVVTNTVHFFKGDQLDKPAYAKLSVPNITKCALSHGSAPYTVGAFIPGAKGAPGKIALYAHPDEGGEQISFRSTYRADSVTFLWNAKGTALLTLVSTNIDTTGKSYYGESEVLYMNSKGTVKKRVELPKEGPTFDVAWSPTGNEFIIIYGYMPSRTTMFNEECEPVFDFGTGSRNTVSFSPHGRYVALAGFGNLAGAIEFWDKNKTVMVGRTELPCTTLFSWSPCSRYFMGATTFPRLRVDNGIRVVRFDGKLIHQHKYGDSALYQATFRPALRGTYADPKLTLDDMVGGPVLPVGSAGADGSGEKKESGVYRPPGSKGVASTVVVHKHLEAGKVNKAEFFSSVASSSTAAVRSAAVSSSMPGKRFVPGMDPDLVKTGPSKSQLARKKKKERERLAALNAMEEAKGGEANGNNEGTATIEMIDTADAGEKKAKRLRKKIRAVELLITQQGEGKKLSEGQLKRISQMDNLAEEMASVEKRIAELNK